MQSGADRELKKPTEDKRILKIYLRREAPATILSRIIRLIQSNAGGKNPGKAE